MAIKPYFSFIGISEKLDLYEDKLAVVPLRKSDLKVGSEVIPYFAITSVTIKKGNLLSNGYIRFLLFGGKNNLKGVLTSQQGDEIIFMFNSTKADYERAVEIVQFIESQKSQQSNQIGSKKTTFKF
jgi:hypothetical protein